MIKPAKRNNKKEERGIVKNQVVDCEKLIVADFQVGKEQVWWFMNN